tara:strand:+ start:68 stop:235 length:168 start_codon:yes stop_codon:yes gene_type:complete
MKKLTESKLYELIKTILEQEFNKEKKKDHDKEDDQKGVELKIDIEDNPFADDEEE